MNDCSVARSAAVCAGVTGELLALIQAMTCLATAAASGSYLMARAMMAAIGMVVRLRGLGAFDSFGLTVKGSFLEPKQRLFYLSDRDGVFAA